MRYSLWSGSTFVQAANQPETLMGGTNQLRVWIAGMMGDVESEKPHTLRIEEVDGVTPWATAQYSPGRCVRWKT